jgi:ubiquinone/menaquinone biosynthesis C-methylase UbiE
MTLAEAIDLIRPGILSKKGTWADIGAGTGMFTLALMEILESGKVIALDKSPHTLYSIKAPSHLKLKIVDADFNRPLELPALDGIVMANALHYAKDHQTVLQNVLASLKPEGIFILIEYDTERPNEPWVPNPVSLNKFRALCKITGLSDPVEIGRKKSIYSDGEIYSVVSRKV